MIPYWQKRLENGLQLLLQCEGQLKIILLFDFNLSLFYNILAKIDFFFCKPGHSPRIVLQGTFSIAPATSVEQSFPPLAGAGLLQARVLTMVPAQSSLEQGPLPQGPHIPLMTKSVIDVLLHF